MKTLCLFTALAILGSCQPKPKVDQNQISKAIKNGAIIIDARTPAEFQRGAYPGAKNIPHDQVQARLAEIGPKEKEVIIYCASGVRSAKAKKVLEDAGYGKVFNAGGLTDMPD